MPLFLEAKLKKQYPGTSVVFIENRANGAAAISTLKRHILRHQQGVSHEIAQWVAKRQKNIPLRFNPV